MKLRRWQRECISKSYQLFSNGGTHFLCLATPGAGKTFMASQLAKKLFDSGLIDLVICFSPSLIVSSDFKEELENQTSKRFDAKLGASGCSITYQAMLSLPDSFWQLFKDQRVFVIFDEIHHCAGSDINNANAWGERIISQIQGKAAFTLALTGTPWRSDSIPITLAKYAENRNIHCDYSYGLTQAINDKVCRTPSITLIDNDRIGVCQGEDVQKYKSFKDLLNNSDYSYQSLIENEVLMLHILQKANAKLDHLRLKNPDAGGLIVASSVAHARRIHKAMQDRFNESADIVTYLENDPLSRVQDFKQSRRKWIISVGMISEGTNLPRLQVCCHLSRIKTELHFRQVLGRILRAGKNPDEKGYLYMPAEPTLSEYALRISEDIPEENVVKFEMVTNNNIEFSNQNNLLSTISEVPLNMSIDENNHRDTSISNNSDSALMESYEAALDIFGKFKHTVLNFNESFM